MPENPPVALLENPVPRFHPTRSFTMTVDRLIHVFAGAFILLSLALGIEASPLFVSPWWLAFTAFVGANLLQYGFSDVCPLGWILRKLGVPEGPACAH
jgi:hypothetical protein